MEKIKQALERARQIRNDSGQVRNDSGQVRNDSGQVRNDSGQARKEPVNDSITSKRVKAELPDSQDISKITYTETKKIGINTEKLREKRVIIGDTNDLVSDQYKVLRTHVKQKLKANQCKTLAVTSPKEGCGKTLTAINLAISLAKEVNNSVLLVDMDLRRPNIHNYFSLDKHKGISDYLTGDIGLNEILFNPDLERLVILPGHESFTNSSEMLSSPKMVSLVNELKARYSNRIVIFDMPPVLSCDDMIAFSPYTDAVMLVVEEGSTQQQDLKKSFDLLKDSHIIGTVLNKSNEQNLASAYY
jgi:protein-tyrosine kinase